MIMRELRGTLTRLGVAAAMILGASFAAAAPVISVDISAPDSGNPYDTYSTGDVATTPNPDGSFSLTDQVGYGPSFNCTWSITVNPDPQITSTFTLTNISGVTQNFVMNVTLPIAAIGPATVQGGYFGDAVNGTTYTDANGDSNVTLNTVGANPFYQALVNGIASQSLGSFGPLGLNANGGPGVQGNLSQQLWGTPIPSAPFGPASVNIRIRWQFSLTPGDSVSTQGFFQVEQGGVTTPEPAMLVLVGLGLAGLVAARKRA
jgi:hypothetical protein